MTQRTEPVVSQRDAVPAYVTKDGSQIRELMHPGVQGNAAQSLAEATVLPGQVTVLHRHAITEELYHFTAGSGTMTLDGRRFPVAAGHTALIAPGQAHWVENTGVVPLVLLCCCSPAYSHDDTELIA